MEAKIVENEDPIGMSGRGFRNARIERLFDENQAFEARITNLIQGAFMLGAFIGDDDRIGVHGMKAFCQVTEHLGGDGLRLRYD
jgi:hypothetical protein